MAASKSPSSSRSFALLRSRYFVSQPWSTTIARSNNSIASGRSLWALRSEDSRPSTRASLSRLESPEVPARQSFRDRPNASSAPGRFPLTRRALPTCAQAYPCTRERQGSSPGMSSATRSARLASSRARSALSAAALMLSSHSSSQSAQFRNSASSSTRVRLCVAPYRLSRTQSRRRLLPRFQGPRLGRQHPQHLAGEVGHHPCRLGGDGLDPPALGTRRPGLPGALADRLQEPESRVHRAGRKAHESGHQLQPLAGERLAAPLVVRDQVGRDARGLGQLLLAPALGRAQVVEREAHLGWDRTRHGSSGKFRLHTISVLDLARP